MLTDSAAQATETYTTPLALTSQFFFCGLPLRLDSYRGCAFQCTFCYARYRGGNLPGANVRPADPLSLRRVLDGARNGDEPKPGVLAQFLRRKVPVHFGGMSDPFQAIERRQRVTANFLIALGEHEYPTVISTRSTLPATEPYLSLLRAMRYVVVQFSFTSTREPVMRRFEPHSPSPRELLGTMERLRGAGIPVTSRWQPYVTGVSEPPEEFARRVTSAGAMHVALEHLKLPLETANPLWKRLVAASGRDLRTEYQVRGATRFGRELVLPPAAKLETILATRTAVRSAGATFGAADNEFQYLSDSACCCSGVDQFPGFGGWFQHQVANAVRRCRGKRIVYGAIRSFWTPRGSVDRYLNSRCRSDGYGGDAGSVVDHIRRRWNDARSSLGPTSFFGVVATERFTANGFRIYDWDAAAERAIQ